MIFFMDVLGTGWGPNLNHLQMQGTLSQDILNLHINILELRPVILAYVALLPILRNSMMEILTDNTSAMSYIDKQVGIGSSPPCQEAVKLLMWCHQHRITP